MAFLKTKIVVVPIGETEESVLQLTVGVTYPSLTRRTTGSDDLDGGTVDRAGQVRVTVLVDPPDAELQPVGQVPNTQ